MNKDILKILSEVVRDQNHTIAEYEELKKKVKAAMLEVAEKKSMVDWRIECDHCSIPDSVS